MPFSKQEDQQQFDSLIEIIRQNKSIDFDYYINQYSADGQPIPVPVEWNNYGDNNPVKHVWHNVHTPYNVAEGPYLYKWKVSNGINTMLTPAFDKNAPVGFTIKMPHDISSADLAVLFCGARAK